jgi:hypothetical protein
MVFIPDPQHWILGTFGTPSLRTVPYYRSSVIFKFVRCALVCKRWYRLSQDDSLWKRLDLGVRTVPPGVVGQVRRLKYISCS